MGSRSGGITPPVSPAPEPDQKPMPTALAALTCATCAVPGASPVMLVGLVWLASTAQFSPLSADHRRSKWLIVEPPSLAGAAQVTSSESWPVAITVGGGGAAGRVTGQFANTRQRGLSSCTWRNAPQLPKRSGPRTSTNWLNGASPMSPHTARSRAMSCAISGV